MIQGLLVKTSLVAYLAVLAVSQLLLAQPGRRVPVYALLGLLGTGLVFAESRRVRFFTLPLVFLAMALIAADHRAGLQYQRRVLQLKEDLQRYIPQASTGPAAVRSQ
jgi:hypothetical protein